MVRGGFDKLTNKLTDTKETDDEDLEEEDEIEEAQR